MRNLKRGVILFVVMVVVASWISLAQAAFPSDDVIVLNKQVVVALSDEALIEKYIDVLVEMEAVKTFHNTSGFLPKEYSKYKEVLKFRLLLLFEVHRRGIELPPSIR